MKAAYVYVLLVVILIIGAIVGIVMYSKQRNIDKTLALCKLVSDTFYDENLSKYEDRHVFGPQGLKGKLLVTVEQEQRVRFLSSSGHACIDVNGILYDAWNHGIRAVKNGTGVRVRSAGPDGVWDTIDDIEYK
jgi:hypothetical protein